MDEEPAVKPLEFISRSPEETQIFGHKLGERAKSGDVYLLSGRLGAGKTCLTQGIAWGLGIKEYAASPTFVLVREMHGRLPLYHIDLYRLDYIEEIADLGLDDYFYGRGVCVVEWAEKGLSLLPEDNLQVQINSLSETKRRFILTPNGKRYRYLLIELKSILKEAINSDVAGD
jgi:tRNA threonylcarbamoyladenosine biosynthesis protein TsaE